MRGLASIGIECQWCVPDCTNNLFLSTVPDISMSDVVSIIQTHSKVSWKHLDKGYKFYGLYVHNSEGIISSKFRWVQLTV